MQGSCLAATTRRWDRPSPSLPSLEPWWPWPSLWYRSARPRAGRSGGGPGQSVHNLHSRPTLQGPHQCDHHSSHPQKLTSLEPLWWPHSASRASWEVPVSKEPCLQLVAVLVYSAQAPMRYILQCLSVLGSSRRRPVAQPPVASGPVTVHQRHRAWKGCRDILST